MFLINIVCFCPDDILVDLLLILQKRQVSCFVCFFLWYHSVRAHDKRIACEEEFSDSEDEGEGGRRNTASFKKAKRAKTEGEKEGEEKEKKGEEEAKGIYIFLSHLTLFMWFISEAYQYFIGVDIYFYFLMHNLLKTAHYLFF